MKKLDITKNKLFQKILSEEINKQVLMESHEVGMWKEMGTKSRELALISLDPKYGDDLAEEYSGSEWNNISSEVQDMLSKVLDQFTFTSNDVNSVLIKANIVRLYMQNEQKLENVEINGSPIKYAINTIKTGRPSVWVLNEVVAYMVDLHIINGFKDPELVRKPKEQQHRLNKSDGSNINGSVLDRRSNWRGKTSEWD